MRFTRKDRLAGYHQMLSLCGKTITEFGVPRAPEALRATKIWLRFRQHMREMPTNCSALQYALAFKLGRDPYENTLLRSYLQRLWAQHQQRWMESLSKPRLRGDRPTRPCKPAPRMRKAQRTPQERAIEAYCTRYAVDLRLARTMLETVRGAYWSVRPRSFIYDADKNKCQTYFLFENTRLHIVLEDRNTRSRKTRGGKLRLLLPLPTECECLFLLDQSLLRRWEPNLSFRYGAPLIDVAIPTHAWYVLQTAPGTYVDFASDGTRQAVSSQKHLERPISSREALALDRDRKTAQDAYIPKNYRKPKKAA